MTEWQQNQLALQKHLEVDSLDDFLRWSTIEKTMFVGDVDFVRREFTEMLIGNHALDYETHHKIDNVLCETEIGNPKMLWGWTSGNLINQYYHLKQWLDRSKQDISELSSIIEIGAGYGALALIIYRLGFKGRYTIIDLPELALVQQYYLSRTLPSEWSNIFWQSTLSPTSCDLFIALHSVDEIPETERLLSQVDANGYLFASSYEFEGVDNEMWLRKFAASRMGYEWQQYVHPYQENVLYLVGVKNELAK